MVAGTYRKLKKRLSLVSRREDKSRLIENRPETGDLRMFQFGTIVNHIKKNWVDIKSITKKIPGITPGNLKY